MIEFFFAMPMRRRTIIEKVIHGAAIESGKIVIGCSSESNSDASTMYARTMPMTSANGSTSHCPVLVSARGRPDTVRENQGVVGAGADWSPPLSRR
jgi:hypothetical protein